MKKFSFMPSTDGGKDLFLKNFANKLPQYAAKYDINEDDQKSVLNSSIAFTYWLNYKNQVDEYNKKLTEYKNELRDGIAPGAKRSIAPTFPAVGSVPPEVDPGIFDLVGSIANRIRKHLSYTESDGKDLGITSIPGVVIDFESAKPVIKARHVAGGRVEIQWTKGQMDGLVIMVDRGEGYEYLATDLHPNFTDSYRLEAGETAIWKYQAIYLKNDDHVGEFSDEVSIMVYGKKAA